MTIYDGSGGPSAPNFYGGRSAPTGTSINVNLSLDKSLGTNLQKVAAAAAPAAAAAAVKSIKNTKETAPAPAPATAPAPAVEAAAAASLSHGAATLEAISNLIGAGNSTDYSDSFSWLLGKKESDAIKKAGLSGTDYGLKGPEMLVDESNTESTIPGLLWLGLASIILWEMNHG